MLNARASRAFVVSAPRLTPLHDARASGGKEAAAAANSGEAQQDLPQALIFDCDGVLADTERDGHRPAFNAAFKIKNLGMTSDMILVDLSYNRQRKMPCILRMIYPPHPSTTCSSACPDTFATVLPSIIRTKPIT